MTADDYVHAGTARHFFVFAHRKMRQRDDGLYAAGVNLLNHFSRCLAGIKKIDIRTGSRGNLCFLQCQSEDGNLYTVKLANCVRLRIAEWFARFFVNDIGSEPLEFGFLHSLPQHARTEVELMISEP